MNVFNLADLEICTKNSFQSQKYYKLHEFFNFIIEQNKQKLYKKSIWSVTVIYLSSTTDYLYIQYNRHWILFKKKVSSLKISKIYLT